MKQIFETAVSNSAKGTAVEFIYRFMNKVKTRVFVWTWLLPKVSLLDTWSSAVRKVLKSGDTFKLWWPSACHQIPAQHLSIHEWVNAILLLPEADVFLRE